MEAPHVLYNKYAHEANSATYSVRCARPLLFPYVEIKGNVQKVAALMKRKMSFFDDGMREIKGSSAYFAAATRRENLSFYNVR